MNLASEIVNRISKEATGETEEDIKQACERIFVDVLIKAGINYSPKYEVKIESGRVDALYNYLCLEYKKPGLVVNNFETFVKEKRKYLLALARKYSVDKSKIIGVLLDGKHIGFFRYDMDGKLRSDGPYPVNASSMQMFISFAQTTTRKALIGENVLASFDGSQPITSNLIQAFWNALINCKDVRTKMFFREWRRLFGQVSTKVGDSVSKEAAIYGLSIVSEEDCQKFIFTIHSVYALIIKHIAYMILSARKTGGKYTLANMLRSGRLDLKDISERIESGEEFIALGIRNFLEGDYFCWYTLEWTNDIACAIQEIIFELAEYEPQTGTLKPEAVRDLMKQLYEGLLSKEMRHSLGEYYTPDWLAEYTLQESGFHSGMRILDPTCGSGTFLILAINRMIAEANGTPILSDILENVCGFDLNPLAVVSARTNYILAIEPYLGQVKGTIELPVYLGDAIFSPSAKEGLYTYFLDSDAGRIQLALPEELSLSTGSLAKTLSKIECLVSCIYKTKSITRQSGLNALEHYLDAEKIPKEHVLELMNQICDLEEKNWDGIWCNIIKNYFSTAQTSDFDIIVGNPPWVRWSDLPVNYRNTIKGFCKDYDLFSSDKFVGGVESDISTMVLYSAADKWLRTGGTLAMLITRTVFKTESSEGFRKFKIPKTTTNFTVFKVEDYTALKPFENATNKPALVVLKKGGPKTKFPIPWIAWKASARNTPKPYDSLPYVIKNTKRVKLVAHPVGNEGSPWLTVPRQELKSCLALTRKDTAEEKYNARKGICTDLNGLYYGHIVGGNFINSFGTKGSTKELTPLTIKIEADLLYPIARGREIKPFSWESEHTYGIIPQNGMHGYPVAEMITKHPFAFAYFSRHKKLLEARSSLKRYLPQDPFYACWNVGAYSFAEFKVCWREISNRLQSCVITKEDGKVVVPDHKIYFVPTDTAEEAHYLCAILNATAIERIVLSYAESTQIGTHIFDYVHIPIFNDKNPQHLKLAELSRAAHQGTITANTAIAQIDDLIKRKGL